jgi:hypothetical protein
MAAEKDFRDSVDGKARDGLNWRFGAGAKISSFFVSIVSADEPPIRGA